jgi:hypothetical protein
LCEENADAVEHHLDVFVQSGAEEEEEGNRYVIPCFFRKSRMCWIYSGLYRRVRVSLGYCQMLISQIGLSGVLPTTFSVQLAFGCRCPSGGIKVNFGVSDAIEIGGRTQFM